MNIVVLGGAGDMGSHIVRELYTSSDAQITIADYRLSKAQALAGRLGERARAVFVDANNRDSLLLALRDADVAVGAVGPFYRFASKMAWAALESHVHYVDICDDDGPVETLLEFDAVARKLGLTLITGLGWTPGLSNILARHGANQLDQADEIHIAWAGGAADAEGLAVVKHVLYAVSGQVSTYREGRWAKVPALSEPDTVEFPEPLGEIEVTHVGHPEPLTIPKSIPVWTVSLKGALTPNWNNRLASMLVRAGLTSSQKRIDRMSRLIHRMEGAIGAGGVPLSGLRVDVTGQRAGQQVTLTFSVADRMGRLTGIPAAIGALMLARGEIQQPGVYAPEGVIDPGPFLQALAARGIEIIEREAVALEAATEARPVEIRPPAEAAPAISGVPSARLTVGEVVEVALNVERRQRPEIAGEPPPTRQRVPSAALRDGQVVEVVLALDETQVMEAQPVPESIPTPSNTLLDRATTALGDVLQTKMRR